MIAVFIDLVVAALLIATLFYCVVLNRRLAALRDDKGELRELIRGLGTAAQRAEAGVASLRNAAEQVGVALQQEIDRACGLRDDLAYMLERGGALADRLEAAIRQRRTDTAAPAVPPPLPPRTVSAAERPAPARLDPAPQAEPEAPPPRRVASFPSRVERDLRRVLEGRR
ncbi:MAG TPA: DUF6468 domain-containing protein [Stellaceae bacterium]|nr:DUF6468 domain-containing protein [Stellaceae bacterium]